MVLFGLLSARSMAKALQLPFEYFIIIIINIIIVIILLFLLVVVVVAVVSLSLLLFHCAICRMALRCSGVSFSESKFLVHYFMALFVLQLQYTALHHACARGSLPMVKALLGKGADVRAQDMVSVSSWSCAVCSVNCSYIM